jgi:hypothetical protein
MSYVFVIVLVAGLVTAAPADAPNALSDAPPAFVVMERVTRGAIEYTYVRTKEVQRERRFEVEINGQRSERKEIVSEFVPEQRAAHMDFDLLDVIDRDGNKLEKEIAVDRLRQAHVVLLAQDNRGVHPAYRKVLATDALILVPKRPPPKPAVIAR